MLRFASEFGVFRRVSTFEVIVRSESRTRKSVSGWNT